MIISFHLVDHFLNYPLLIYYERHPVYAIKDPSHKLFLAPHPEAVNNLVFGIRQQRKWQVEFVLEIRLLFFTVLAYAQQLISP